MAECLLPDFPAHEDNVFLRDQYVEAVLDAAPQGMVALDESANIVWSNRRARNLLRLPLRHLGHPLGAYVTWEIPESPGHREAGGSNAPGFSRLWSNPAMSGESREFLARRSGLRHFGTLEPVFMKGGERAGGLFTVLDKDMVARILSVVGGLSVSGGFACIVGQSSSVRGALHMAGLAAESAAPVLVCGEPGSGKTLFVRAIHNAGHGEKGPFVTVDCAAVPRACVDAELFGEPDRPGKVEAAHAGTLFLDNIHALPLTAQDRLMRVLRGNGLHRNELRHDADAPSSTPPTPVYTRLMAATSVSLQEIVQQHRFLPDLYYRLTPFTVQVPALRERVEDILLLAVHFVQQYGKGMNRTFLPLPACTEEALKIYAWPGNVRELEYAVERAVHLSGGALLPEHFGLPRPETPMIPENAPGSPPSSSMLVQTTPHTVESSSACRFAHEPSMTLEAMEALFIKNRMQYFKGNISRVAASLGISRPTLYRKIGKQPA